MSLVLTELRVQPPPLLLMAQQSNHDAERREREAARALHAKAEQWNAEELALFAYMAALAKERLAEINAQDKEVPRG